MNVRACKLPPTEHNAPRIEQGYRLKTANDDLYLAFILRDYSKSAALLNYFTNQYTVREKRLDY